MIFLNQAPETCTGCDVAKDEIVLSHGPQIHIVPNNLKAIRKALKELEPDFVICEPTGGYEHILLSECLHQGIRVHRADIMKVKAFIRSWGTLGKSDAIDAQAMASYGKERWQHLPLWQGRDENHEQLRALVRRRNELIGLRVAENNRARAPGANAIKTSLHAMLKTITRQIKHIEIAIDQLIEKTSVLREKQQVCVAMGGIGRHTAAALVAFMPELGNLNRKQAASLSGLAPHPNESGKTKSRSATRGGRPEIPRALYMSALIASTGKGEFASFYKRLINNGKKPSVAITAVMRKIVITLNARVRDNLLKQS